MVNADDVSGQTPASSFTSSPVPDLGRTVLCGAAAASVAAAVLHVSAAIDHRDFPWQAGAFWASAAFQALWALVVLRRRGANPLVLWAGVAANAGFVVLWFLSRTSGLAFMPGSGHESVEPVGGKDATCVLLEGVLIGAACLYLFLPELSRRVVLPAGRMMLSGSVVAATLALGVGMLDLGSESGHGHEAGAFLPDHGHAPGEVAAGTPHGHAPGTAGSAGVPMHAHAAGAALGAAHTSDRHPHEAAGQAHDPAHVHDPSHMHDPATGAHSQPGDAGHDHAAAPGEAPHEHPSGSGEDAPHDHGTEPGGDDHHHHEPTPTSPLDQLLGLVGLKPEP